MSPHLKLGTGGHLLRNAGGHLVIECDSPEPTCDIDCTTLASAYTVLGVGNLTGCASCLANTTWPAWNGVVQHAFDCQWMLYEAVNIAGMQPSFSTAIAADCTFGAPNGVGIVFSELNCRWELAITCRNTFEYHVIWAGTKSVEFSPAGVYERVCGCDTTPTLTVV